MQKSYQSNNFKKLSSNYRRLIKITERLIITTAIKRHGYVKKTSWQIISRAKGLRRNKFTILEVEAPGRQDAEAQESAAADSEFPQRSRTGWIDV
jgi:hypothetical protein